LDIQHLLITTKQTYSKKIVSQEPNYNSNIFKISPEAIDLLKLLLKKDPERRIKPEQIPYHPWFKGMNFEDIKNLKYEPPFKPKILNQEDISNIDPCFTKENVHSPVKKIKDQIDQDLFKDF